MLNANNKGEGLMALLALISRHYKENFIKISITTLAIFGAALFYGDGFITPAISVISAIEGLTIASYFPRKLYRSNYDYYSDTIIFYPKKGTTLVGIFLGR